MKFSIAKNDLSEILEKALRVTPQKSTVPIIENIKIVVNHEKIMIISTDFEREVLISSSDATIESTGEFLIDPKKLKSLTNYAPKDQKITIELKPAKDGIVGGTTILVYSEDKSISAELVTPFLEEFPGSPSLLEEPKVFRIKGTHLINAINRVEFAAASDLTRVEFNSVYFDYTKESFNLVSTNSIILAKTILKTEEIDEGIPESSFLLPVKSARLLEKLFSPDSTITVFLYSNRVTFEVQDPIKLDTISLSSRIIDGRFPDYERVIPPKENLVGKAVFNTKEMLSCLNLMSQWRSPTNGVNITHTTENSQPVIICESDKGHSYLKKIFSPSEQTIETTNRFYIDNLLAIIKAIPSVKTEIHFYNTPQVLIRGEPQEDTKYILMPQRES